MDKKWIIAILAVIAAGLIGVRYLRAPRAVEHAASSRSSATSQPELPVSAINPAAFVPAHYEIPPASQPQTLAPEKFSGHTREAYQAAKDIPQTLAQLPCYCQEK